MAGTLKSLAFFNGVRLWEYAITLRAPPLPGNEVRKGGLSRPRGLLNPRSRGFVCEPYVVTSVEPQTAVGDLSRQVTKTLQMLQTQDLLIGQSQTLGYLSWVQHEEEFVEVDGIVAGGAAATVPYTGAGFAPAVGQRVLLRGPDGEGFVTSITAAGGGNIQVNLQRDTLDRDSSGDPVVEDVDIDTAWRVYLVRYYFPRTVFEQMDDPEVDSRAEDSYSLAVRYTFSSESPVQYAALYAMDLT